ncbi:hypothetical protein PR202_ga14765 [Eleusine coracana subsp. coracana]|uniref:Uncharacterized protein n=1 Tax=Eleusine coracana subsp. coracana TaxID=191504 RepID=A0AAV5CIA5_ELECO|nr:hypothetical protein PR202_ga14765 [Eleusine coracana subsp. coracana]
MRPVAEFPMTHGAPTAAPTNGTVPHSPWQSPVPYLFGGLAAMLGLIAFALLILACSYWKLSGYLDAGSGTDRDRAGSGADGDQKGSAAGAARPAAGFLEHVVVIMAGEERPTFLATPAASRAVVELGTAATSAPGSCRCSGSGEEKKVEDDEGASSHPRLEAEAASSRSNGSSSTTALQESSQ